MSPLGTTKSASTRRMALRGIAAYTASVGLCTMATPPACFTIARPAVPSSSTPETTTPITRSPYAWAADRNKGPIAGRWPFSVGPCTRCSSAERTITSTSGGRTYTCPPRNGSPSTASPTSSSVARARPPERAERVGAEVEGDDERDRELRGHARDHAAQRLDPAGRRADDDHALRFQGPPITDDVACVPRGRCSRNARSGASRAVARVHGVAVCRAASRG